MDEKSKLVIGLKLGMQFDVLNSRLQTIKEQAFSNKENLASLQSSWDRQLDIRILCFAKFIQIFDLCQFDLQILNKLIADDLLVNMMFVKEENFSEYKERFIINFESATKYRFGMS